MLIPMSTGLVQGVTGGGPTVAYVVSGTADSITAIDISDPSNLTELGSYTSANLNNASGVALG